MALHRKSFARPLAFLLALSLAACGARAPSPRAEPGPGRTSHGFTVTRPNFGESHPVDWNGNPPSSHQVHGIDISVWQGAIDWPVAKANGVNFAFLKATEGGDHEDPAFAFNWRRAEAAGVPRGAYHFFYHCRPAAEQARWFISHVPRSPGALPPVLDVEWTPRSPTCPGKRPATVVRGEAQVFLKAVGRAYGQRPILYTTVDFYRENELWKMNGVDFWLRSVAAHPSDRFPGQHWLFWQYSGTGSVPGIDGATDLNVYAGTAAQFTAWLASHRR